MLHQQKTQVTETIHPSLERAIGETVRTLRLSRGMTVAKLSGAAGLSIGMLSKIENGGTSPSLRTLLGLSRALNVPVTTFFHRFDAPSTLVHVPAAEMTEPHADGPHQLLAQIREVNGSTASETYVVEISDGDSLPAAIRQEGIAHIHMHAGAMSYSHGETVCDLETGDMLIFDAATAHGVVRITRTPLRYIVIVASSHAQIPVDGAA